MFLKGKQAKISTNAQVESHHQSKLIQTSEPIQRAQSANPHYSLHQPGFPRLSQEHLLRLVSPQDQLNRFISPVAYQKALPFFSHPFANHLLAAQQTFMYPSKCINVTC